MYAALLPIIAGVGLASLKELSFTWTALIAASLANQAAAFKNVVSKGEIQTTTITYYYHYHYYTYHYYYYYHY